MCSILSIIRRSFSCISPYKVIPLETLETCTICLEPMYKDLYSFECTHKFHIKCALTWISAHGSATCPLCRVQDSDKNIFNAVVRFISI